MWVEDVGTMLQNAGVGTVGTTIFLHGTPDMPDGSVGIVDTGGPAPEKRIGGSVGREYHRAQIIARSTSYSAARTLAWAAYRALRDLTTRSVNGAYYQMVMPLQCPFPLGEDESGRQRFVFNVVAEKNAG